MAACQAMISLDVFWIIGFDPVAPGGRAQLGRGTRVRIDRHAQPRVIADMEGSSFRLERFRQEVGGKHVMERDGRQRGAGKGGRKMNAVGREEARTSQLEEVRDTGVIEKPRCLAGFRGAAAQDIGVVLSKSDRQIKGRMSSVRGKHSGRPLSKDLTTADIPSRNRILD